MLRKQAAWKPESLVNDPRPRQAAPVNPRSSHATARVLQEMPLEIAEDELLVGKTARNGTIVRTALPEFAAEAEKEKARAEGFTITGGLSHKTPDYPTLLAKGLRGILNDIADQKDRNRRPARHPRKSRKAAPACRPWKSNARRSSTWRSRYADLADQMAATAGPERAAELRQIAAVCRRVPEHPAHTFREALQSVWLVHYRFLFHQHQPVPGPY